MFDLEVIGRTYRLLTERPRIKNLLAVKTTANMPPRKKEKKKMNYYNWIFEYFMFFLCFFVVVVLKHGSPSPHLHSLFQDIHQKLSLCVKWNKESHMGLE